MDVRGMRDRDGEPAGPPGGLRAERIGGGRLAAKRKGMSVVCCSIVAAPGHSYYSLSIIHDVKRCASGAERQGPNYYKR
jgi:hypothetical protein